MKFVYILLLIIAQNSLTSQTGEALSTYILPAYKKQMSFDSSAFYVFGFTLKVSYKAYGLRSNT